MFLDTLWRNRTLLSLGFCFTFSLLGIFWKHNPFAQNFGYLGRFADRFSGFLNFGFGFTSELWIEIDKYRTLEQRYEQAKKLIEVYRLEKNKIDSLRRQNQYLREALNLPPTTSYKEVQAEILGLRLNSISPRIIINKGKKHGIKPLMPIIAHSHDNEQNAINSIVGITVVADNTISIIQPITHPSFQIGVRIEGSQEWAVLSGNSGQIDTVLLTYISSNFNPDRAIVTQAETKLKKNAVIYTSGAAGIFPPGIPIGYLKGVGQRHNNFKTAYVHPFANVTQLNYVSVILKEVAKWSEHWKQKRDEKLRWKEHLQTEFGKIEYPNLSKKRKKTPITKAKKTNKKNKSPRQEDALASKQQKRSLRRRRLQNLRQLDSKEIMIR